MRALSNSIFRATIMPPPTVRPKVMQGRFLTYLQPRVNPWRNLDIMRAIPMRLKSPAEQEVLAKAAMKRNRRREKALREVTP